MVYKCISKENLFSKVPGGPIFSRRIQLFQGGVKLLIPMETYITCKFPGEGVVSRPTVHAPSGSSHVRLYILYNSSMRRSRETT